MSEFSLAHIGINAANETEALQAANLFGLLFGFNVTPGRSSIFAGPDIEIMKTPYLGTHGHIAIGTPDVAAARAELESHGFAFAPETEKHRADGTLAAVYLKDEICGFAVHLVGKQV